MTGFARSFLEQASKICTLLDYACIDRMADKIAEVRDGGGRLFILGVGGSAGNAGHAVNDFRKLCDIETYAPTDNVSELTARTNDEGWETVFEGWLKVSRVNTKDALLVFSVGGGSVEAGVSVNLVRALKFARDREVTILGVVGRDGGFTATVADCAVVVPPIDPALITPYTEAFQAVVWHCLVSHPALQKNATKW